MSFNVLNAQLRQYGNDRIIPPSPTASSLGNYGNVNVGMYTGTANVDIPIHTLSHGDIKLPIVLSGTARAIAVGEVPGWVGSGFSLQAGGVISRSTIGLPDDLDLTAPSPITGEFGYLYNLSDVKVAKDQMLSKNLSYNLLDNILNNMLDIQPDIFSYNFNGYSGKFYIDYDGNVHSFSQDNIKFNFEITTSIDHNVYKRLNKWTAQTPDGNLYTFESKEWTLSGGTVIGTHGVEFYHISSWYLTSITSPTGFVVNFNYTTLNTLKPRIQEYYFDKIGKWECNGPNDPLIGGSAITAPSITKTETIVLSSISTPNVSINFHTSKRNDLYQQYTYGTIPSACADPKDCQEDRKLDKIEIKNDNKLINRFDFIYNENSKQRLQLRSIIENGKAPYYFEYNGTLPDNLYYSSKSIDHWGFYNGATNVNLIPPILVNIPIMGVNQVYGSANREPNYEKTKLGSLKKITYPTGGFTEFEYEPNHYNLINDQPTGVTKVGGGLRISKVTSSNEHSQQSITKVYEYTQGVIGSEPTYKIYLQNIDSECQHVFWLQSSSIFTLSYTAGNSVGYQTVKEVLSDGSYTTYTYSTFADFPDGALVFSHPVEGINFNNERLQLAPTTSMDHMRGRLKTSTSYNNMGQPLIHKISEYSIKPSTSHSDIFVSYTPVMTPDAQFAYPSNIYFPIFVGYRLKSDWVIKTADHVINYDPISGKETQNTINYYYDNPAHLQITKTKEINSQDEEIETIYKYPGDDITDPPLTSSESQAATELVNKNVWNKLIEKERKINGISREKERYSYKEYSSSSFPQLEKISQSQGGSSLIEYLKVNAYDDSYNRTEEESRSGIIKSYIWGYNKRYPIAEVLNAKHTEVFFDPLEESDTWNGIQIDGTKAHTGASSARIDNTTSSEIITQSKRWLNISLDNPTSFTFSGWVYSTGPSVDILLYMKKAGEVGAFTYVSTIQTNETNKWVYIKGDYIVPANVTQLNIRVDNNGIGSIWFDDIRLHPSSAQMTTFTYEPLVGLTSKTDINNQTLYFEYDDANRLNIIRDNVRNIVKTYEYNYRKLFYNTVQYQQFSRNNCPPGYYGTPLTYTVPAGKYSSYDNVDAANALAQIDIQQNGQAYANNPANGAVCYPSAVYPVLSYENFSEDGMYADIVLRFYSDANHTNQVQVYDYTLIYYVAEICSNHTSPPYYHMFSKLIPNGTYTYNLFTQANVSYSTTYWNSSEYTWEVATCETDYRLNIY